MKETKEVTWRSLKPGQKIEKYREGNCTYFSNAVVYDVNSAYVTLYLWGDPKHEKRVNSETAMFAIELTEKEFHNKYYNDAKEIVKSLRHHLEDYEIGHHEMWNGWIEYDPYELAASCRKENIKILGYHKLDIPRESWSGEKLEIGIVVEDECGERFWCHISKLGYESLTERHKELMEENV